MLLPSPHHIAHRGKAFLSRARDHGGFGNTTYHAAHRGTAFLSRARDHGGFGNTTYHAARPTTQPIVARLS
jgi:hypothetical protein